MNYLKAKRTVAAAGILLGAASANAFFVPVDVAGTATGNFTGSTTGFSYAPGVVIDGANQFEDTSSQYAGSVGYYGISPVLDSGSFGEVSLVAPAAGSGKKMVYSGDLMVDVFFTSPTNTSQVYEASVEGSITGSINASKKSKGSKATGGVTISFSNSPIEFKYGPYNQDWFSLQLNPITFGPNGGSQAITGYGQTYAAPGPAGAAMFLVGALGRRRKKA
jgi:hypothetical protein